MQHQQNTIYSIPLFISNKYIKQELSHFGKIVSCVRMVSINCKNLTLKHAVSFRHTVLWTSQSMCEKKSYMLYTSTGSVGKYMEQASDEKAGIEIVGIELVSGKCSGVEQVSD